ncbi:DUF4174 domain-containing protein [uncultured Enterovirga sp.]|uniref:DUF4174 domain-containing protein n=1 Tax=uncultured Enterovirga sp. TaxID=2026352 RepID=UPI0035CA6232
MTPASLALLAASAALTSPAAADGLDLLAWSSRALVVVAPSASDPRLAEQTRLYAAAARGARERDLVLVEGVGRDAAAEGLRRRFGVAPDAFVAILVGKDGGAKLRSAAPIPAERLFAEIDQMPMRQDEMRRGVRSGAGR